MYAFVMFLEKRTFQSIPHLDVPMESGIPLMIEGKLAVILGAGSTRAEAKSRGTEYYNRVSKWHGEECTDWAFNTQDVGGSELSSLSSDEGNADEPSSPSSHEGEANKRKRKTTPEDKRKRRKSSDATE